MEAGRFADDLIFEPGFVRGGPASDQPGVVRQLNSTTCSTINDETGEIEPECWLYHQADFMLQLVPADGQIGSDIDFFMLPPIDPSQPTPAIGARDLRIGAGRHARGSGLHGVRRQSGVG